MKSFDELLAMSDDEKLSYLSNEAEKVIQAAPANKQLKLRALQAKCDGVRKRIKNAQISKEIMYHMMMISLYELNEALKK